jgi:small subunit ribosomal protein S6
MLERYRSLIEGNNGAIHRLEDWGRRQLTFPIAKLHKAHYVLMNIECDADTLSELEGIFRFNDAVLRHLTVVRQEAISEQSLMMKAKEEKDSSSRKYEERKAAETPAPAAEAKSEEAEAKSEEAEEAPAIEAPAEEVAEAVEETAAPAVEESTEDADAAKSADA